MKKIKKIFKSIGNLLLYSLPYIIILIAALISVLFAYWVSISDLPDWFKFWLLRK